MYARIASIHRSETYLWSESSREGWLESTLRSCDVPVDSGTAVTKDRVTWATHDGPANVISAVPEGRSPGMSLDGMRRAAHGVELSDELAESLAGPRRTRG